MENDGTYNPAGLNNSVQDWSRTTTADLKATASSMGIKQTGAFIRMLKERFHYSFGEIDRVGFKVPRYAIFSEKGLGRGVGMNDGVRYATSKNIGALLRRKQKPWYSTVMDQRLPVLADHVAKAKADAYVKATKIN